MNERLKQRIRDWLLHCFEGGGREREGREGGGGGGERLQTINNLYIKENLAAYCIVIDHRIAIQNRDAQLLSIRWYLIHTSTTVKNPTRTEIYADIGSQ